MTREEIFVKLNEIFRDVLGDDSITVTENTTAADISEWDSISHIDLVVTIEEEFEIEFSMEQVVELKNVGEMVDLIIEKME